MTRAHRITALLVSCLALAAFECRAELTVGIHLVSAHIPQEHQRNDNWGAYVLTERGQIAGAYRNSHDRTTVYVGQTFALGPIEVGAVLATGYDQRCNAAGECKGFAKHKVTPLAAITCAIPIPGFSARPRVWVAPGFGKAATVAHVSLEF